MYVTLEPCAMCTGALVNARIQKLVYNAQDPKTDAVRSLFRIADDARLNHRIEIVEDGDADEVILSVADEVDAQLIVLGTHGHGFAPLLEIGSTAAEVMRHANVSVLVVPTPPDRA